MDVTKIPFNQFIGLKISDKNGYLLMLEKRTEKVTVITGISNPSVYKLIADLERLDILIETTGGKRGKNYVFQSYINAYKK